MAQFPFTTKNSHFGEPEALNGSEQYFLSIRLDFAVDDDMPTSLSFLCSSSTLIMWRICVLGPTLNLRKSSKPHCF